MLTSPPDGVGVPYHDAFRLFVEAWVHAQRDQEHRGLVAAGMDAWRTTFKGFGKERTSESVIEVPDVLRAGCSWAAGYGRARRV